MLVAHGSADPRAASANRGLAEALARALPGVGAAAADGEVPEPPPVRVCFLDHAGPRPGEVLFSLAGEGHRSATVVPLLLTAAYHGRVDLPAVLDRARTDGLQLPVAVTDVLGPVGGLVPQTLLAALRRRLTETGASFDAVVLAAAGTRDSVARCTVEQTARALGARLGVPCAAAYAAASGPTGAAAVAALRAAGAQRIIVAGYFLAPGRLYETVVSSALGGGAVAAAEPLGDAPELARLVLDRVAAAWAPGLPSAA